MGRLFVVLSTALLLLASTATASDVKVFNDGPVLQGEDLNLASLQPYASPPYDRLVDDAAYWQKDLLLFKLMKSLQQGDSSVDGSPYFKSEYDYMDWGWPEASDVKESDVKRWVTSLNNSASSKASKAQTARHQSKWKIKTGKGFASLCYFKLCSFRRYR